MFSQKAVTTVNSNRICLDDFNTEDNAIGIFALVTGVPCTGSI